MVEALERADSEAPGEEVIYQVKDLVKLFPVKAGFMGALFGREQFVHAVDGITFDIKQGEILGVVGESGCGETFAEREDMVAKALESAEMRPAEDFMSRYPHELSGGQRQRVAIARALA